MLFYGSAMRFPHVQGAFRERLVAEEAQCVVLPVTTSPGAAAMCEPFAVALHAVERAGPLIDRRVLITGSGPIGTLIALAARLHGAREIVATDIVDEALARIKSVAADRTVNVARETTAMADFAANKGTFDVMFESSGNQAAIRSGLGALKPRGVLVQVGLGGTMDLPQDAIVTREIEVRGAFRFINEFALAAALIGSGRANVRPLITQEYELARAKEAFDIAGDRKQAMKVQLLFDGA
jgi:L-idonate 5-dehydrogenase